MSSRGSKTRNGHVTTTEYYKSNEILDAVILNGNNGNHGLPDLSHSPNRIYIKENSTKDGGKVFRELRVYNQNGECVLEIGYHPEPTLTCNRHTPVLHAHEIDKNLQRHMIGEISSTQNADIYNNYKKYLEVYGL